MAELRNPTVAEAPHLIHKSLSSAPTSVSSIKSNNLKRARKLSSDEQDIKNVISLCNQFIKNNNHLGLALLARQKGIPPSLRYKVWPILLKYHPYVIDPYINSNITEEHDDNEIPEGKIRNELLKYFRIRTNLDDSNSNNEQLPYSALEKEIIGILEAAIEKFFKKWGAIIKYDYAFAWIALNLAEWFPPIPDSNFVLIGRDVQNKNDKINKHLVQLSTIGSNYSSSSNSENTTDTEDYVDENASVGSSTSSTITSMNFAEVYERLVLVLLHANEEEEEEVIQEDGVKTKIRKQKNTLDSISTNSLSKNEIIFKTGKVESRISFFMIAFAKVLPELYKYFNEEEIINNNSNKNNQWLTWWLKYCGTKVLNKVDRARLWDLILGFRLSYKSLAIKYQDSNPKLMKRFKKVYNDEELLKCFQKDDKCGGVEFTSDTFWFQPLDDSNELKWSQVDYQLQLVFIYISILRKSESNLLEFDQSEIKEFLNKLPLDKPNREYEKQGQNNGNLNSHHSELINNTDYISDDFEKVLNNAGELWRNWLWNEIRDEINENA